MREGLLWYDDDPRRRLEDKVRDAAARYQQRFGIAPNVCYVNAQVLETAEVRVAGISLRRMAAVQPNYFWIGHAA